MTTPAKPVETAPETATKDTSRADARKTVRIAMQEYLRRDSFGPVLRLFIDFSFLRSICLS